MASKEQIKLNKKKEKEKRSKSKVLVRRNAIRAKAREEREEHRRNKRHDKFAKDVGEFKFFTEEQLASMDEETLLQLEKNCNILRGLEEEYEKEINEKKKLNKELEEKGHKTLQEKLKAISDQSIHNQKNAVGGVADCNMDVIPINVMDIVPKNDTAEVGVVKANK